MSIKRVVCGISGGVDSAVSALLLKKKGFEVIGLFMKNWDIRDEKGKCSVDDDREDAQFVCKTLGIPLYEVDFVKHYWNEVFCDFVKDYENGLTPNPDILCNRHIKFNHFVQHAVTKLGADAIATGHYARTSVGYHLDRINPDVGVSLMCAEDVVKDQTFFLAQIPQWALQKTIFPLGDLLKHQVKAIAAEAGMDKIAKKKESMGVCFIGKRDFHSFIEEYIEPKEGNFVDVETGAIVGKHKGTHNWTLGQRTLLGGLNHRYYVCEVRPHTQDVIVAPKWDHPALLSQTFETSQGYWIQSPPEHHHSSQTFDARFRFQHKHPLIGCSGVPYDGNKGYKVTLDRPLRALTPGQYAVFYKDNMCLGSARIERLGPTLWELDVKDRVVISKEFS